jgi:PAT family beta-lactamase induction signal transducer AmpG
MGTGAFSVLLLRLTEKRFSATQYALFSSLFGLPRLFAGPVSGFLAYGFGWRTFFWITVAAGIPGMLLLARFVPLGVREPVLEVESAPDG